MDAETKGLVDRAALRWCGKKSEFSLVDAEYFRQNWQSLPGLNQYVIDEAAAAITRLTAERDEAHARAERAEAELAKALSPQWFYDANGDQERASFDVGEVVEQAIDWAFGSADYHAPRIIEVSTARPLPSIWVVARAYTDAEKDARDDDELYEIQEFATEAEAKAAYAALTKETTDGQS